MAKSRIDQAEGLRRLLERGRMRIVSVSSPGNGDAGAIVNLAGALAEIGSDVLILDERPRPHGVAGMLGLSQQYDLNDVVDRRRSLDDIVVRGPAGIRVLPLAAGARSPSPLPERDLQDLMVRFGRLGTPVDTLLVDAAPGRVSSVLSHTADTHEVIVLAGSSAGEITAAYALIKRLSNEFARREFHVFVSNVASENQARNLVGNIARVAQRYLRVTINFMGHVPPDEKLHHAARLRIPVVAAFPNAFAAGSYRRLAQTIIDWPRSEDDSCDLDDVMDCLVDSHSLRAAA